MEYEYLTITQMAKALKISKRHLINLENANIIPSFKLGRVVRFSPEAVKIAVQKLTGDKK
jgi:excisionase family DNA binding protein